MNCPLLWVFHYSGVYYIESTLYSLRLMAVTATAYRHQHLQVLPNYCQKRNTAVNSTEYRRNIWSVELWTEFLNRRTITHPLHEEQGWKDGQMIVGPISCKRPESSEPLHLIYYSELVFVSPHFQSIRPNPSPRTVSFLNDTHTSEMPDISVPTLPTNISGISCSLNCNTMESVLSNISILPFESTALSVKKTNTWARLEPLSKYFNLTDMKTHSPLVYAKKQGL